MNTDLPDSLNKAIDRHAGGQPVGKLESHDLESLSKRILAPVSVTEKLIADGVLCSEGPVHKGDEGGLYSFRSDDLNDVRRAVLTAIVERVVDESSGHPDEISLAAGQALREHAASFEKKRDERREFGRALGSGAVMLSRSDREDEQPGPFQRVATTGAKVAAVAGAGYGAASLVRGRYLKPGARLVDQLRAGSAANVATVRGVAGSLSSGASKVAAILSGRRPPSFR